MTSWGWLRGIVLLPAVFSLVSCVQVSTDSKQRSGPLIVRFDQPEGAVVMIDGESIGAIPCEWKMESAWVFASPDRPMTLGFDAGVLAKHGFTPEDLAKVARWDRYKISGTFHKYSARLIHRRSDSDEPEGLRRTYRPVFNAVLDDQRRLSSG